jgi:hypothetical protein
MSRNQQGDLERGHQRTVLSIQLWGRMVPTLRDSRTILRLFTISTTVTQLFIAFGFTAWRTSSVPFTSIGSHHGLTALLRKPLQVRNRFTSGSTAFKLQSALHTTRNGKMPLPNHLSRRRMLVGLSGLIQDGKYSANREFPSLHSNRKLHSRDGSCFIRECFSILTHTFSVESSR